MLTLASSTINDAFRVVTERLRSIPMKNPFVLTGIQPTELRCQKATLSLARCTHESEHLLHERLSSPSCGHLQQLKSRYPLVPATLELLNDLAQSDTSVAQRADHKWSTGVADKYFQTPCIHCRCQFSTSENVFCETCGGQAKPPSNWRWAISFNIAQTGYGSYCCLPVWRKGANS